MRQDLLSRLGAVAVITTVATLLGAVCAFAGTPTLGSDCGSGAALVGTSSDSAGKVALGADPAQKCTLTFGAPYTNAPACSATDETTGPRPLAAATTASVVTINTFNSWYAGDVVSYICAEY
jgi:hypothetical protein